ncbi:heme-binding protein [Massilia antarctica]|uniref:heme-binding protein n=1 Tax=Massilia antarctica TaxID=2765360 RepID=UPI0035E5ED39
MTLDTQLIKEMVLNGREIKIAEKDDEKLGPLRWLPGQWKNTEELNGFGFNMMALPFQPSPNGHRLLMNQYNEVLNFSVVDAGVPNRGLTTDPVTGLTDQTIVALEYNQIIHQITSDDSFLKEIADNVPVLSRTGISDRFDNKPIHHEPGLWLYMTDQATDDMNIARTGSIPHGNSFIAVGSSFEGEWDKLSPAGQSRIIPRINGVVVGGGPDPVEVALEPIVDPTGQIIIDYFAAYRHFHKNPFTGSVKIPGFNGMEPVHTTTLLTHALETVIKKVGTIKQVKKLHVDSTMDHSGNNRVSHSGISSIPFVVREADTTAMNATFIIYEVEDFQTGHLRYFLQYAQNVILDFINRPDGHPGRARWPHVSINTLERVADASPFAVMESLKPI